MILYDGIASSKEECTEAGEETRCICWSAIDHYHRGVGIGRQASCYREKEGQLARQFATRGSRGLQIGQTCHRGTHSAWLGSKVRWRLQRTAEKLLTRRATLDCLRAVLRHKKTPP